MSASEHVRTWTDALMTARGLVLALVALGGSWLTLTDHGRAMLETPHRVKVVQDSISSISERQRTYWRQWYQTWNLYRCEEEDIGPMSCNPNERRPPGEPLGATAWMPVYDGGPYSGGGP